MFCDLCGESTNDADVVDFGHTIVDACQRCVKILQIAVISHPSESAWMN
jgi:hypothetical protein